VTIVPTPTFFCGICMENVSEGLRFKPSGTHQHYLRSLI
jgi:hypothetical protein